jgi:hypothetical protein
MRCTSGTATLEGAIVIPVAISLMAGGVEFGQLFSAYGTAEKSMRDAARYLARVPQTGICTWGRQNARNLALYGNLSGTGNPLIPTWTDPTTVDVYPSCPPPSDVIDLRANVPYTGLMFGAIGLSNVWTLYAKHQERFIGE